MVTAYIIPVSGFDCSVGSLSGQLIPSGKGCIESPPIHVEFTPSPTAAAPRLLHEIKAEGKHKADVRVTQKQGYFCHIEASVLLELPPSQVYDVLTHPGNSKIFKAQKECTYRKVLGEEAGVMTVEVEHSAAWNFLFLSGTFHTRQIVEQSKEHGKVSFHLLKSTVLNKFDGEWHFTPVVESPDDSSPRYTLLQLVQDMLPAVIPPPPADRLFRRMLGGQIGGMFGEIQAEVEAIRKGTPQLEYPPDQNVHINAEPRTHTASLSKPRSRADLTRPSSRAELQRPSSRPDLTHPSSRAELQRPSSRPDLTRPSSRAELQAAGAGAGAGAAAAPGQRLSRRPSLHAHSITLDEEEMRELGVEIEWEDDEESMMFYDCLDEVESFNMLVERAGSSGLHLEPSASWLLQQAASQSLEEDDAIFEDAQEELCADARA